MIICFTKIIHWWPLKIYFYFSEAYWINWIHIFWINKNIGATSSFLWYNHSLSKLYYSITFSKANYNFLSRLLLTIPRYRKNIFTKKRALSISFRNTIKNIKVIQNFFTKNAKYYDLIHIYNEYIIILWDYDSQISLFYFPY